MQMCSTLGELKKDGKLTDVKEAKQFVDKWREDFLKEAKDDFIASKVDDICHMLMWFLLIDDDDRTLTDNNRTYVFNFNSDRKNHILCFSFCKPFIQK